MNRIILPAWFLLVTVIFPDPVSAQVREIREVKGFTGVNYGVAGELVITTGPEFKLVIEGSRRALDDIETYVRGNSLIIRNRPRILSFWGERITMNLTMPRVETVSVSGSGRVKIPGDIKADYLGLDVSGSGRIACSDLEVKKFECGISGSGSVKLGPWGKIEESRISISGSGGFSGEGVEINDLEVKISGSGNCRCLVSDNLRAYVSGSGNVIYSGNPSVDARVSGSGYVRSR